MHWSADWIYLKAILSPKTICTEIAIECEFVREENVGIVHMLDVEMAYVFYCFAREGEFYLLKYI